MQRNARKNMSYSFLADWQPTGYDASSDPGRIFSIDTGDHGDRNRPGMKLLFIHWRLPPFNGYSK